MIGIAQAGLRVVLVYGWGIGEDQNKTTQIQRLEGQERFTEIVAVEPAKELWDWLNLLGVPITLATLGFVFQRQEGRRAEKLAEQQELSERERHRREREKEEENTKEEQNAMQGAAVPATVAPRFPPFSKHNDTQGYNRCVIPKQALDSIVESDFAARKELIMSKMQGLKATILKIDFSAPCPVYHIMYCTNLLMLFFFLK